VAFGLDKSLLQFKDHFTTKTHPVYQKALSYVRGLYKSEKNRANCTSISDTLGELDHQSLNHLLSESPWDYQQVLNSLSKSVSDLFEANDKGEEVALLFDEVGFRKKGDFSACVSRQYLGCLGKQDNGQVAVVAGLSSATHYCPISGRLFMPDSWDQDHVRRKKCKIPDHISHESKPTMVFEMLKNIQENEVKFDYIAFDALYGSSYQLLKSIDQQDLEFIGDVSKRMKIFTSEPIFSLPKKKEGQKGGDSKGYQVDQEDLSLDDYQKQLSEDHYQEITFRDGTKKKISAQFHQKEVWITTSKAKGESMRLQLIIRKDDDGTTKYSFSNAHQCPIEQLARRQGQRVFIERIFEEGKNQLGLGDYQVRSWQGFHKHLTLSFLAFYYVAEQKIKYEKEVKLTSAVIRKLVAANIISRWNNPDHTIELCFKRLILYQKQIQCNLNEQWIT